MIYHILNGDSLAYSFPDTKIQGEMIIVREAFISGDLSGDTLPDFWQARAKFTGIPDNEYRKTVVKEFEKIMDAVDNPEFYLWFEYDLFCQVNLWFILSLINNLSVKKKVFAVYSSFLDRSSNQFWNGFGQANTGQLIEALNHKIELTETDLKYGADLWLAYKNNNLEKLKHLSKNQSAAFPYIGEVIDAHIDRFPKEGRKGRPERVLEEITKTIATDFHIVFNEFWKRESIYGFGDTQLKQIYDEMMS